MSLETFGWEINTQWKQWNKITQNPIFIHYAELVFSFDPELVFTATHYFCWGLVPTDTYACRQTLREMINSDVTTA
jgi:hypothetical protein